jgi:hypothetical protein
MMLKLLLVLKMASVAASPGLPAYEECSGRGQCDTGLVCSTGLCLPTTDCETATDCGEAPEGYSVVCEVSPTCEGDIGTCHLGPGQYEECPLGTEHSTTWDGQDICVG